MCLGTQLLKVASNKTPVNVKFETIVFNMFCRKTGGIKKVETLAFIINQFYPTSHLLSHPVLCTTSVSFLASHIDIF